MNEKKENVKFKNDKILKGDENIQNINKIKEVMEVEN